MADYRQEILDAHNQYRSVNNQRTKLQAGGLSEITYDMELEDSAKETANLCKENPEATPKPYNYDRNTFIMLSSQSRRTRRSLIDIGTTLETWFHQAEESRNILGARTNKVGCAISKCGFEKTSGEALVCHYYPKRNPEAEPENQSTQAPQNVDEYKNIILTPACEKSETFPDLCSASEREKQDICILEGQCDQEGTNSCSAGKHFFKCECKSGFIGDNCQFKKDPKEKYGVKFDKKIDSVSPQKRHGMLDSLIQTHESSQNFMRQKVASRRDQELRQKESTKSQRTKDGMLVVASDVHTKKCLSIQHCNKSRIACKAKLIDCFSSTGNSADSKRNENEKSIIKHRPDSSIYSVHYDRCLQMGDRSMVFKKCTGIPDQKFKFKNGILSNLAGTNCVVVKATNVDANWARVIPCHKVQAAQVQEIKSKSKSFYSSKNQVLLDSQLIREVAQNEAETVTFGQKQVESVQELEPSQQIKPHQTHNDDWAQVDAQTRYSKKTKSEKNLKTTRRQSSSDAENKNMKISTVITLSPAELLDASNRVQIEIADFIKLRRNESVEATVDPAKYVNNLILSGEPAMQKFAIHSSAY